MVTPKKILVFTDWYLPGFKAGGPIRSIANIIETLDHDFFVVTRNTDLNSHTPYKNVIPGQWSKVSDNCYIWYFEEKKITRATIRKLMHEQPYDWFYLNSLFSKKFTLFPLRIAKKDGHQHKILLAPRGMLKKGALNIKSRKKKIFLRLARYLGWFNGIVWHATNEEERNEIQFYFGGKSSVRVAPNLSLLPKISIAVPTKESGQLKLICVARISPEKGIYEAISYIREAQLEGEVTVDFFGTQQNLDYLERCKQVASEIPHVAIRFPGPLHADEVAEKISQYHFFYLATQGENFGHAIVESLMASVPVIISNTTPWKNVEQQKAGWSLPLQAGAFTKTLRYCLNMENKTYLTWRAGARKAGEKIATDEYVLSQNHRLFDVIPITDKTQK